MASPADIKSIFLAATEKPPTDRPAYLAEACGDDSALRQRVEALLKAHDNTGGWLGETATPTSDYPGFTAPSIDELAPHFPQLEILELLGQGGMGAVYKARQKNLDRLVALKILPHDAGDRGFAERFTREARTLAKLNHPGIVAVHDFGTTGELYWFVMEFVDGVNLRQAKKAGTLTPAAALAVVPKICEALQFAHDAGIVHRDIKPENVLLDAKGRVKIADFGLAKLVGRPDRSHLTGTHQAMGTPHYMAPEQWEKPLEVDHRADIYSLGVVFYELLTGELPLGRFSPPSQKVQIDVRLDEVVLRTLEKEPARRYQQASEVKTDLEKIGSAPFLTAAAPALQKANQSSFFRQVLRLPLIIAVAGILALVVYSIFPADTWDKGVRENITAVAVISMWISGCVLALNLSRWYLARRREAMASRRIAHGPVSVETVAAARRRVAAPSCGLLLIGVATLLISLGIVAWSAMTLVRISSTGSDPTTKKNGGTTIIVKPHSWTPYKPLIAGALVLHAVAAGLGGVIAFAAISMRRLEYLGFAQAGSLLAMLPMSVVWPAGLCVGLWSLLTLRRPEVEAAFDRQHTAEQETRWKPTPSFVLAIAACLLGIVATFIPWSQLRIFGFPVTIFGFDMWNGIVAGSLFFAGALLLIGLEMMFAEHTWRLVGTLGIVAMIALVLGAYFWEVTRETQITSSSGDNFLKPLAESFFAGNIGGSLMFGPFVSAFALALLLGCALVQYLWRTKIIPADSTAVQHESSTTDPLTEQANVPAKASGAMNPRSLSFWVIVVCLLGIVNAFLPWMLVTPIVDNVIWDQVPRIGWQSGFQRHFEACSPVASAVFPTLGLFLLATSGIERMRTWRVLATVVAGLAVLGLSISYINGADGNPNGAQLLKTWFKVQISVGPFIAIGLSAGLLIVGVIDFRGWLANRPVDSMMKLPSSPQVSRDASISATASRATAQSLKTWAIVVCVIGAVNVWFPWFSDASGQSYSLSSFETTKDWWQLFLAVGIAFLVTSLLLFVTSVSDRLQLLRIVAMLLAALLTLILAAVFVLDFPRSMEGSLAPSAYLSLGLSTALLLIGCMDLRSWLAIRSRA